MLLKILWVHLVVMLLNESSNAVAADQPIGVALYEQYHEFTTALDGGMRYGNSLISVKIQGNVMKELRSVGGFKCGGNECSISVPHVEVFADEIGSDGFAVNVSKPTRSGTAFLYEKGAFKIKIRSNLSALYDSVPGEAVTEKTGSVATHTVDANGRFVEIPIADRVQRVSLSVSTKTCGGLESRRQTDARGNTVYIMTISEVERVEVSPKAATRDLLKAERVQFR